jgi:hypothetical protein
MNLCMLSSVKALLDMPPDHTKYDETLQLIIAGVSRQIEAHLNRKVLAGTYTEYFDVLDGASRFSLKAYPVSALTSVTNAPSWQWSSGTVISATSIDYASPDGVLNVYAAALAPGPRALRVIYTGGMAASVETLEVGDYADVALAAVQQTIAVWNNRRLFGVQAASVGSQSLSPGSASLLESVKELLGPHRRLTHV